MAAATVVMSLITKAASQLPVAQPRCGLRLVKSTWPMTA
jgi:hypothetical protein